LKTKNLLLLVGATVVSLLLAEGGLRLAGYQPWTGMEYANRTRITQFHPQLGWDLKEGIFQRPPYSPQGADIVYTHLPGGLRQSHPQQNGILNEQPKIVMVGGSYTHGTAITDDETFPWKLQQTLPGMEVLNYSVGGYGTLQSLVKLQQVLPKIRQRKLVIYGLIRHHSIRNVSTTGWITSLSKYSRNDLYIPYVKIDKNNQMQHQPLLHFSPFPLRQYSALIALLENTWISTRWGKHDDEPISQITVALVSEMQELSNEHNADFLVVLLSFNRRDAHTYTKALIRNEVNVLNCSYPLTRDMIVIGDGHPNGKMNTKWARCIGSYLDAHRELLPASTQIPAVVSSR
jgi:hypothetical protein